MDMSMGRVVTTIDIHELTGTLPARPVPLHRPLAPMARAASTAPEGSTPSGTSKV